MELLVRYDGMLQLAAHGTNLAVISSSSAGLLAKAANKQELQRVERALAAIEISHSIGATDRWTAADAEYQAGLQMLKDNQITR